MVRARGRAVFSFPTRWVLLAVCSAMVTFISFLGAVKLNGCGEAHNNNLDCDILVAETEEFPKDAFTISLWVKASAPHEGRKYEEGEALFSFNTAKTVASTKSLTTSQIAVWQYYDEYLIFIISDGDKFGSIVKQMRSSAPPSVSSTVFGNFETLELALALALESAASLKS